FARRSTTVRTTADAHRRRFLALAIVFVVAQSLIVLLCWGALYAVDVARAFASGEATYAKAQKASVISLLEYETSHDPAHYAVFTRQIGRNLAARDARIALERDMPDFDAATAGLLKLGIAREDTFAMNVGFVLFKDWGPIAKAADAWRNADAQIA